MVESAKFSEMFISFHRPIRKKAHRMPHKQKNTPQLLPPVLELDEQLKAQRRMVDFDTFDIHTKQLIQMLKD